MIDKILTSIFLTLAIGLTPICAFSFPTHPSPLVIHTQTEDLPFHIEIPKSDTERKQGLMFRKSLPSDSGMLFVFEPQAHPSMWMKNTLISLDMLFINDMGQIVHIASCTKPHALDAIQPPPGIESIAVLELNANTARQHNIQVGDQVSHPLLSH